MAASAVDQIVQYIVEKRCALFVGPDLSESAGGFRGLPTTWQLADEMCTLLDYRGRYRTLPQIAQLMEKEQGRPALVQFLRQRIDSDEFHPLPVHEMIARIPFTVTVSGGWDTLLEQALTGQQAPFFVVRKDADIPFLSPAETRRILFKPYGTITDPDSLVVTEDDQFNIFYQLQRVVDRMKDVIEQYALLLLGYAPAQDGVFVRLYHDIHRIQAAYSLPAVAVQSMPRSEDAEAWQARGIEAIIDDPVTFLCQLAEGVARAQGQAWTPPDLATISSAPRVTVSELETQAALLNSAMDHIGVADLVEQSSVPLLSDEQLRDIEAMRTTYERLTQSFAPEQGAARVWLRQGNLEYARRNYECAADYYNRALAAEPNLAEVYHNLHFVRLLQQDWPGALAAYQRAIELEPALRILPERYQIETILGGSGVGIVYKALDTQTNQPVAVKVLQPSQVQTEHVFNSFKSQAAILQELDNPHIIKLLDAQLYRGNYFLVLEFLTGQTLKEALAQRGEPYSLDQAMAIMDQLCDALSYAHQRDIIHRDVRPSNIFLTDKGQVKLIDFDLAQKAAANNTLTFDDAGMLGYLAPEQVELQSTDVRADEYAAASIFYELVTGINPALGAYSPISDLQPGLNNALDLVVEKARQRRPTDRYLSVAEFHAELRQVAALQAAAAGAPLWVRLTARTTRAIQRAVERYWLVWLAVSLVVGFLLAPFLPGPTLRELARYGAAASLIILVMAAIAGPFCTFIARRVRAAPIAAYGPLLGLILGLANSLLWLPSFSYDSVTPQPRLGYAGLPEMGMLVVSSILFSLGAGMLAFLALPAGGALARRLRRSYTAGAFIAFGLVIVLLLLVALTAGYGWLGDLSVAP